MIIRYFVRDYSVMSKQKLGDIIKTSYNTLYIWGDTTLLVEHRFTFYNVHSFIIKFLYCIITRTLASKKDCKRVKKLQKINNI